MKKWYRMPRVKFFFAGSGTYTCSCRGVMHPVGYALSGADTGAVSADAAKTYEESNAFAKWLWPMPIITSWTRSNIRPYMITDGKYDPDKIVDCGKI